MSGSVALTKISCITASCNSIPQSVSVILDRRLSIREDEAYIKKEMNQLTEGFDAEWEICDIHGNEKIQVLEDHCGLSLCCCRLLHTERLFVIQNFRERKCNDLYQH